MSKQTIDERILDHVRVVAGLADDKQAEAVTVLDLRGLTAVTDYFIIATGRNARQLHAIADDIYHTMKCEGTLPIGRDGLRGARWIVLDYGDFVVHLFDEDARQTYDLDLLWGDAKRVDWA